MKESLVSLDADFKSRESDLLETLQRYNKKALPSSQEIEQLSQSLCVFTELESKNFKLLLAETGDRSMAQKVALEIAGLQSQIKLQ